MSGNIVFASADAVAQLAIEAPVLYNVMMDCIRAQPEIDPEAGYGVFQVPNLFNTWNMESLRAQKLVRLLDYSFVSFYTLVRAEAAGAVELKQIEEFIDGNATLDMKAITAELQRFVPSYMKASPVE